MRGGVGVLLLVWSLFCWAEEIVRYPTLPSGKDPNEKYIQAILQLGLQKSGKPYRLVATKPEMLQSRAILEARKPDGLIDVLWSMTTSEREAKLLPIRIPIDKGLLGWRVVLTRTDRAHALDGIKDLADLRPLSACQGHDWPDTTILRFNGLNVITSSSYDTLFSMLQAKRCDFFPRSIMEVWNDLDNHLGSPLAVDHDIVIHYPAAAYFFVSPRRPQLAKDLQNGLEKAIFDGSFERLFQSRLGPFIERAQLQRRRVIELSNPLLGDGSLPLNRAALWFKPEATHPATRSPGMGKGKQAKEHADW
ncbi:ABC transporter substrate-binding protein [Pseudogulbenkiania sp. MAI-1]|uniref:ABC transporter substrate-binding protein n=1 Tax=Pseudogulbenkiania sp. MAI-1 TaxID=990370 RepID=UPI00045EC710|nr:ABC transporter substrate-binding protein [Pseudogulbenkiania sp. MAI-1]